MSRRSQKLPMGLCHSCQRPIAPEFRSDKKYCNRKCEYRTQAQSMGREPLTDVATRFWSKVEKRKDEECWEWRAGRNKHGYGVLSVGGRAGRMELAHRISFKMHHGHLAPGMLVRHACDNPGCVNPFHLLAGTQDDNMRDMAVRERCGKVKLTAAQIPGIRAAYAAGEGTKSIAERHGVTPGCIGFIVAGKTWRHVR